MYRWEVARCAWHFSIWSLVIAAKIGFKRGKMHNFLFENDIVRILGWRKQMMWQQHDASNFETDTQIHNFRFEVGRNSMQNEEISKLTRYYASSHETFVNNWNQINNLMLPSNKWIDDYVKAHNTTHSLISWSEHKIAAWQFEMFSIPHNRFLNQLTFLQ